MRCRRPRRRGGRGRARGSGVVGETGPDDVVPTPEQHPERVGLGPPMPLEKWSSDASAGAVRVGRDQARTAGSSNPLLARDDPAAADAARPRRVVICAGTAPAVREQGLTGREVGDERGGAVGVELGEHVVEQQHRWRPGDSVTSPCAARRNASARRRCSPCDAWVRAGRPAMVSARSSRWGPTVVTPTPEVVGARRGQRVGQTLAAPRTHVARQSSSTGGAGQLRRRPCPTRARAVRASSSRAAASSSPVSASLASHTSSVPRSPASAGRRPA